MRVTLVSLLALLACGCVLFASASTADAAAQSEFMPAMPAMPTMSAMLAKLTMDDESSGVVPAAAAPLTELEQLEAQAAAEFEAENGGAMVEVASDAAAATASVALAEVDAASRVAVSVAAESSVGKKKGGGRKAPKRKAPKKKKARQSAHGRVADTIAVQLQFCMMTEHSSACVAGERAGFAGLRCAGGVCARPRSRPQASG